MDLLANSRRVKILWTLHPSGTSIVSDICDLSKVSDIGPLTGESMRKSFFYHLFCITHKIYFSKDFWEIYRKNLIKYGDLTYVETFMDPIRMIQIFMDFYAIDNNVKKCLVMWVII